MLQWLKNWTSRLAEYDVKHHASALKWSDLIIWGCSLIAEVGTFAMNPKLPKDDKRFIVDQELVAGGINLGLMFVLADFFQRLGFKVVEKGWLIPGNLPAKWRNTEAIKKILAKDANFIANEMKGDDGWVKTLVGYHKGMSVLMGIVGTMLAVNITAPLISNKIAAYFYNKALKEENTTNTASQIVERGPQTIATSYPPTYTSPYAKTYNASSWYNSSGNSQSKVSSNSSNSGVNPSPLWITATQAPFPLFGR